MQILRIFWQQNYKPGMGLTFQEFIQKLHRFKQIGEMETLGYLAQMEDEGLLTLDRKNHFAFLTQEGYTKSEKFLNR
jgi:hypothetical protein